MNIKLEHEFKVGVNWPLYVTAMLVYSFAVDYQAREVEPLGLHSITLGAIVGDDDIAVSNRDRIRVAAALDEDYLRTYHKAEMLSLDDAAMEEALEQLTAEYDDAMERRRECEEDR